MYLLSTIAINGIICRANAQVGVRFASALMSSLKNLCFCSLKSEILRFYVVLNHPILQIWGACSGHH